jgi:hypothetical protein
MTEKEKDERISQLEAEIANMNAEYWNLTVENIRKKDEIERLKKEVIDNINGINTYIGNSQKGGLAEIIYNYFNIKKKDKHTYKPKPVKELFWIKGEKTITIIVSILLLVVAIVFFIKGCRI